MATEHASYRAPEWDPRDASLGRWASLVRLHEEIRGDLEPEVWEAAIHAIIAAIMSGHPVGPVYRRKVIGR